MTAPNLGLRIEHYRSFADSGWLVLRPVAIVNGANGSGKTGLLQPLPLLKQTRMALDRSVALVTRGDLVNVGHYKDLVHCHDVERQLAFSLRWHWQLVRFRPRASLAHDRFVDHRWHGIAKRPCRARSSLKLARRAPGGRPAQPRRRHGSRVPEAILWSRPSGPPASRNRDRFSDVRASCSSARCSAGRPGTYGNAQSRCQASLRVG